MEPVNAIVDGNKINYLEPISIKGRYEVTVIFNKPVDDDIEEKIKRMEACFGIFDEDDVKMMEEIVEERVNFSKGREVNDIP